MVRLTVSFMVLWCLECGVSRTTSAETYPTENDFKLVRWIKSPAFLQMELFTMASGNDLAFPPQRRSTDDDLYLYKMAESVAELWLQLATTEQINRTIDSATAEAAQNFTDLNEYRKVLKLVFDKIEQSLRADADLYEKYLTTASKLNNTVPRDKKVYFWNTTNDRAKFSPEMLARWLQHPRIRKYAINGDFLYYGERPSGPIADSSEREWHVLARSVLELAKNATVVENVQDLYDDALVYTVNRVTGSEDKDCGPPLTSILFEAIEKNFENSPLGEYLESIKRTVNAAIPTK